MSLKNEERCPDCHRRLSECVCEDTVAEEKPPKVEDKGPSPRREMSETEKKWLLSLVWGVIIVLGILFFWSMMPEVVSPAIQETPKIVINRRSSLNLAIDVTLFALGILIVILILFLETYSRKERFLLDWWVVPLTVVLLSYKESIPNDFWVAAIAIAGVLNCIAIFVNESESGKNKLDAVDLTPLLGESSILIMLYFQGWKLLPYPTFVPIWLVVTIFILSLFRELLRTPILSIIAMALGFIMAITLNPWVIVVGSLASVMMMSLFPKQGWAQGKRKTDLKVAVFGNQSFALILPWDIVLAQLVSFLFSAYFLYGNFVLFSIGQ